MEINNSIDPEDKSNPILKNSKATYITTFIIFALVFIVIGYQFTGHVINNNINITNNIGSDNNPTNNMDGSKILLKTTEGDITIQLYDDMPTTTNNFKKLTKDGTYNGVIFHRIIDKFMIQGGDPTGTGFGDPAIPNIKDEFTHAGGNKNNRGTISMANAGPNTGSSQFFINLVDNNFLDSKHPAFGEVIEGMDIVDKIAKAPKDARDKPITEIKIISAEVI
jgi:peptidylprolyl isomerase